MSAHEGSAKQEQWAKQAESGETQRRLAAPGFAQTAASKIATAEAALSAALDEKEKDADPLNDELQAMRSVARTLEKLPYEGQRRVLSWLNDRLPPRLLGLAQGGIVPAETPGFYKATPYSGAR